MDGEFYFMNGVPYLQVKVKLKVLNWSTFKPQNTHFLTKGFNKKEFFFNFLYKVTYILSFLETLNVKSTRGRGLLLTIFYTFHASRKRTACRALKRSSRLVSVNS